jgi:hypothetical protein
MIFASSSLVVDVEALASQVNKAQKVVLRGVRRGRYYKRPLAIFDEGRSKGRKIAEFKR